jgi:formylglycine-generating enzyme required for sulfatase activity
MARQCHSKVVSAVVFVLILAAAMSYSPGATSAIAVALPEARPMMDQQPASAAPIGAIAPTSTPALPQPGATRTRAQDGMVMVYVPAGEFTMGSPTEEDAGGNEHPQQQVWLDAFWIDKTEVTNQQFASFVGATAYRTDAEQAGAASVYLNRRWVEVAGADWQHPGGPDTTILSYLQYPVVQVSWNDARAYCAWVGARLPNEAEWEKAARGTDGRYYPWGNDLDGSRLNFCDRNCATDWKAPAANDGYAETSPVGSYPAGASPYGALDMAGNVTEWTSSLYQPYPYQLADGRENPDVGGLRILRGGSWSNRARRARTTARDEDSPGDTTANIGFRCVT